MNKRMKDPKGDLRFVHKSTRVYDFWSLKLTAMAWRQAGQVQSKDSHFSPKFVGVVIPIPIRIPTSSFLNRGSAFDINFNPVFRISYLVQ